MTVPGVNVICAATVLAAFGDIRRFRTSSALVGYLGLDPRVRQSGTEPAKSGRISKRGSSSARWVLVDLGDVVVHVFHRDEREYYNIERLWSDAKVVELV